MNRNDPLRHRLPAEEVPPTQFYPLTELPLRTWMLRKRGKTVSKSAVVRWALHGKRGVRLKTILIGGCRATCDAWAIRFFEELSGLDADSPTTPMTARTRQSDHEAAEAELAAMGF